MQYTLKKSLGQHFLRDENICRRIADAIQQQSFTQLLEVGPGGGALTKYLLQFKDIDFKAVELDEEKVVYLEHTYPELKGRIIHQSFLDAQPPFEGSFMVVGNFPYNISSQILFKVLDWKDQVPHVVGMFQKEVAQRVASKPGSKVYGVISVLIQAFYNVEYLFDVPQECFNPPPKVMSGVILLTRKTELVDMRSHKHFVNLVKTAFNQRRKTLRNAARSLFTEDVLQNPIFDKRAEQLSLEDFAALTFSMNY
ncbi:16S rRNA (adenine1518-N6/adenine1519-N6)-dimethyltransferase [Filimonas zeae]|uniref:Ribosomal RNA small subunit methyltransferase A n=1 Tax=Filimonas zeae TaxID=1737353 RepID=A0A917MXV6_9BACT|nr:16S rRNA (adenine(1518)-N(6)/adenine(1519)-N(6))-dimethyltransferase RsmA [Filimonas zeae]MDR6341159.1 16S rRNA (adenine1518-N6/adenine1519-N6)-dimethyltransferase [Filimonas zeae]GGH76992.1 ribosomal RNA small subunit methyltransferase A [Filimonas zeae]